jgi:hypothetical protein
MNGETINCTSSFFIVTATTCFGLRPSSGRTNMQYTSGNFAKLTTDPLLEHWFFFSYSCSHDVIGLLDELVK